MLDHEQCDRLLARLADGSVDDTEQASLDAHLAGCARCRAEAEAQRAVFAVLSARRPMPPPPDLAARIAAEIAREFRWLGVADWRGWSFRLGPVAAGLLFAAFLWDGRTASAPELTPSLTPIVEAWMTGDRDGLPATSVFWQSDVTADTLISTVLRSAPDDVLEAEAEDETR
jgi:anti-sigma factor RsiW